MHSGITNGRVLNGELLYTKILEVYMFAFVYRLLPVGARAMGQGVLRGWQGPGAGRGDFTDGYMME